MRFCAWGFVLWGPMSHGTSAVCMDLFPKSVLSFETFLKEGFCPTPLWGEHEFVFLEAWTKLSCWKVWLKCYLWGTYEERVSKCKLFLWVFSAAHNHSFEHVYAKLVPTFLLNYRWNGEICFQFENLWDSVIEIWVLCRGILISWSGFTLKKNKITLFKNLEKIDIEIILRKLQNGKQHSPFSTIFPRKKSLPFLPSPFSRHRL